MRSLAWLRWMTGCLAASLTISAAGADDIVVGQVAPLSGVLADTGKDMVLGAKIYFDHVNSRGGVHGRKIRHVVKDDGYKVEETVRLTKEVIDKDGAIAL
ncbi:MAG TPA: ABC transporter substrate-binding protein, partial [Noviherbaspirillum sp.]